MSQELERVYTIPLGKALLSQSQHRSVRAINMIREFARKHMKTQEIKIDEEVAHLIWSRGVRSPPRKIRVKMTKTDEGHILVSSYEEEVESTAIPTEVDTPKVTKKVEAEKVEEDGEVEEYVPTKTSEDEIEEEVKKESKPKAAPKKESKPKAAPKKESKPKAAPKKESKPKAAPKKESKPKAAPKKESKPKAAPKKSK